MSQERPRAGSEHHRVVIEKLTNLLRRRLRGERFGCTLVFLPVVGGFATGGIVSLVALPAPLNIVLVTIAAMVCWLLVLLWQWWGRSKVEQIALLEDEFRQCSAALALADSGRPFALFLRSFRPEAMMFTEGDEPAVQERLYQNVHWLYEASLGIQTGISPDFRPLKPVEKWAAQVRLLSVIQSRLPVILLGNEKISRTMRRDLEVLGVCEIVLRVADWWTLVTALCAKARLIVFLVEQNSPNLLREMTHAQECGYRYIVIGDGLVIDQLPEVFEGGQRFIDNAEGVFIYAPETQDEPPRLEGHEEIDQLLARLGL